VKRFSLRKGLDVAITGAPRTDNDPDRVVPQTVGLLGDDYIGLKPRILVAEGDRVGPGSPVMVNKDVPEAMIVSPVSGVVKAIHRGARRKLISVEIAVGEGGLEPLDFSDLGDAGTREGLTERLCAAGVWTSFRSRPYSKVPAPGSVPAAIYVTASETEPLAPEPATAILAETEAFTAGLAAVARLTDGPTHLCQNDGAVSYTHLRVHETVL